MGGSAHEMDELAPVHPPCVSLVFPVVFRLLREMLHQQFEEIHHHLGVAVVPPERIEEVPEPVRARSREIIGLLGESLVEAPGVVPEPEGHVEVVLVEFDPLTVLPYPKPGRLVHAVVGAFHDVADLVADQVDRGGIPGVEPAVGDVATIVRVIEVSRGMTAAVLALMKDGEETRIRPEAPVSLLGVSPRVRHERQHPPHAVPRHVVVKVDRHVIVELDELDELLVLEPVLLPGPRRCGRFPLLRARRRPLSRGGSGRWNLRCRAAGRRLDRNGFRVLPPRLEGTRTLSPGLMSWAEASSNGVPSSLVILVHAFASPSSRSAI